MVGEIHLAKIYFTDLSQYKIRPVLILREFGEDCLCLPISTQFQPDRIELKQGDLIDGALKKDSVVIVPKNFTLHRYMLIKYIAKTSLAFLERVDKKFCEALGCNSTSSS